MWMPSIIIITSRRYKQVSKTKKQQKNRKHAIFRDFIVKLSKMSQKDRQTIFINQYLFTSL